MRGEAARGLCVLPISHSKNFPAWFGEAPGCWPAELWLRDWNTYRLYLAPVSSSLIIVYTVPPVLWLCLLGDRTLFMQTVFGSKMTAATMGVLVQLYQYVQINRLGKKQESESNQTKRALFLLFLILHFHLIPFGASAFSRHFFLLNEASGIF